MVGRHTRFVAMMVCLLWVGVNEIGLAQADGALERPELTIGFIATAAPYVVEAPTGLTGIDVEMMRQVTQRLGFQMTPLLASQNRLERMVSEGIVDVMVGHVPTSPVCQYGRTPVSIWRDVLVASLEAHSDPVLDDVVGQAVAVYPSGVSMMEGFFANKGLTDVQVLAFSSTKASIQAMRRGRVAFLASEANVIAYQVKNSGFDPARIYRILHRFDDDLHYACTRDQSLIDRMEPLLKQLHQSGQYKKIEAGFTSVTAAQP